MNDDEISNTPGGERMLLGGIVVGFAYVTWHGLRYELGTFGTAVLFAAIGVLSRGNTPTDPPLKLHAKRNIC